MTDCAYTKTEDICVVPGSEVQKASQNRHETEVISVTPVHLKFSFDSVQDYVAPVTLWNKTKKHVRFRIILPQSDVFQVYCDQQDLYANSEATLYVKCKPHNIRMCVDSLEIHVQGHHAIIRVTLELFPNVNWFVLPKFISLPLAPLSVRVEAKIRLPVARGNHAYNFCIISPVNQFFTVTPRSGTISGAGGGGGGVKFLTVSFIVNEYLTLTYKLRIRFPEVDSKPYEVEICGRCAPNVIGGAVRRDVVEIEKLTADLHQKSLQSKKKKKEPILRLVKPMDSVSLPLMEDDDDECATELKNILTPAGIMKFLLQKGSTCDSSSTTMLGPLGVDMHKSLSSYQDKKTEFNSILNKLFIHQNNLLMQHHKEFVGRDSIDSSPQLVEQIKLERERFLFEYEKAVGMKNDDVEDLSRTKLKKFNQRQIREAAASSSVTDQHKFQINDKYFDASNYQNQLKQLQKATLRPFIQAACLIITRWRGDRRLKKLKKLMMVMVEKQKIQEEEEQQKKMREEQQAAMVFKCPDDDDNNFGDYVCDKKFFNEMNRLRAQVTSQETKDLMDRVNSQLTQLRRRVNYDLRRIRGFITEKDFTLDTTNNFDDGDDDSSAVSKRHNDLQEQMARLNEAIQGLQNKFCRKTAAETDNQLDMTDTNNYEEKEDDKLMNIQQNEEARITKEIENLLGPDSPLHAKYKMEEQELRDQLKNVNGAIDKLQEKILSKSLDKLKIDFNKEIHRLIGDPPPPDSEKEEKRQLGAATVVRTIEKLPELLNSVNTEITKIPSKFKTHRLKSIQNGMNSLVQRIKDDPTGEKKFVRGQLKKINSKMDKLQTKMGKKDGEIIGRLQNELNEELRTISPSSRPITSKLTAGGDDDDKTTKLVQNKSEQDQEIQNHVDSINQELNKIPQKYKTSKVKQIQKEMNDTTKKFIQDKLITTTPKLKLENDVRNFEKKFSEKVDNLQQNLIADLKKAVTTATGVVDDASAFGSKNEGEGGKNLLVKTSSPTIKNVVNKYEGQLSQLEHQTSGHMKKLEEQENDMLKHQVKNKLLKIGTSIQKLLEETSLSGNPDKAAKLKKLQAELYKELGLEDENEGRKKSSQEKRSLSSSVQKMSPQELKKLTDIINGEINNLPTKFRTESVRQVQNSIGQFLKELLIDQAPLKDEKFVGSPDELKQQLTTINTAIDKLQEKIGHNSEISRLQTQFNDDFIKILDQFDLKNEVKIINKLNKKIVDNNNDKKDTKMDPAPTPYHQELHNIQNHLNQAIAQLPDKFQQILSIQNLQEKINSTINQIIINNEPVDEKRKADTPIFGPEINDSHHIEEKEELKQKLQKINTEVDKVYAKIFDPHPNIFKLQQQFNDQFNKLLLLPDAQGFLLKSNKKFDQSSQSPTSKELETIQHNVNTAFSQLPDNLRGDVSVQNLQESINSFIHKIITDMYDDYYDHFLHVNDSSNHNEKLELIDTLTVVNDEIDRLQDKIRNWEIRQAQENFNDDFNRLFFLPNEFYEELGSTRRNHVIRKSIDGPPVSQLVGPIELKILKQNINLAIQKFPEKFFTPTAKDLQNTVNTVVDKLTNENDSLTAEEEQDDLVTQVDTLDPPPHRHRPSKPLEGHLDRLNLVMDELRAKLAAHHGEIGGLQKELNQTIRNLLGLDLDDDEDEESPEEGRKVKRPSNEEEGEKSLTLEQLQEYLQRINDEFDQIPEEYKTEALKIIQLRIHNAITNLQNKISHPNKNKQHRVSSIDMAPIIDLSLQIQEEHAQFQPLRKRLNDEIDDLQQKIVSSDLWHLQEELNLEFDFILSSRKGGWDIISTKWQPKRLPWSGTLPKKPNIELKQLHTHSSNISRAFNDIPDRFKTQQVETIKRKMKKLLHKLGEQFDVDKDRKNLRQQQTKINEAIEALQKKIMNRDINKLHRQLADEIVRLLDLPNDDEEDEFDDDSIIEHGKYKRLSFSGASSGGGGTEQDGKEEQIVTLQELKYHVENINREINQIPIKFKTQVITTAQLAINEIIEQFRQRIEEKNAKSPEGKLLNEIHRLDEQYLGQVKRLKSQLIDTVNKMDYIKMSPCDVDREKETYEELVDRLGEQIKYELDRLQVKLKGLKEIENKFQIFDTIRNKFQTANSNTVKLKDMVKALTHHLKEKIRNKAVNDKIQQRLKLKLLEDKRSANGWIISGYSRSRRGKSKFQSRHHGLSRGGGASKKQSHLHTVKSSKSVLSPFVTEPGSLSRLQMKKIKTKNDGDARDQPVCAVKLTDAQADKLIEGLKEKK